jgi:hypothetical protein
MTNELFYMRQDPPPQARRPEGAGQTRFHLRADGVLSAGGWVTILRSSLRASSCPVLAAVLGKSRLAYRCSLLNWKDYSFHAHIYKTDAIKLFSINVLSMTYFNNKYSK